LIFTKPIGKVAFFFLLLTSVQPTTTQFSSSSWITKKIVFRRRERKGNSSGIYACEVLVEYAGFIRKTHFLLGFSVLSLFWKIISSLMRSHCCLCLCISPVPQSTFECLNQSVWKLAYHGIWAHLNGALHASFPKVCVSMCICLYWVSLPRQRIHAKVEELLDAAFSMLSMSYDRKGGDKFFLGLLVCIESPNDM
jgi:hypothetical protein